MTHIRIIIQAGDYEGDLESGLKFNPVYAEATVITSLDVLPDLLNKEFMMNRMGVCYDALKRSVEHRERQKITKKVAL